VAIRFHCTRCDKRLKLAERPARGEVVCPYCGSRQKVPAEAEKPAVLRKKGGGSGHESPEFEGPIAASSMRINFEDLIDMTAMVDIVFFLLIFFLVTSMSALNSSIPMPAPDPNKGASGGDGGVSAIEAEEGNIVVRIDRNDKIWVEGAEVRDAGDLLFRLRELQSGPGRPDQMLVLGSGDATHGTAVMVLDAGHEVGLERVRMAIQEDVE
jgi:biopolymer transport protein ExbD